MNILERELPELDKEFSFVLDSKAKEPGTSRLAFICLKEGELSGLIISTWRNHSKICNFHDFYVKPEHRANNIGLYLMKGVLVEMMKKRLSTVIGKAKPFEYEDGELLETTERRRKALLRFYAQLGFETDRYLNFRMDISKKHKSSVNDTLLKDE